MRANYKWCIDRIIRKYEGGYSNNPNDPGGPTMYGITYIDLAQHLGVDTSKTYGMMQHMLLSTAEDIYARKYETASRFDDLPSGVDMCILDYDINSGVGRGPRVLQAILGLAQSKVMTDATVFAAQKADPLVLIDRICDERILFMRSLKGWTHFGTGWSARIKDLRATAKSLAAIPTPPEPPTSLAPALALALVSDTPAGKGGKATHIDPRSAKTVGKGTVAGVAAGAASHAGTNDFLITACVVGVTLVIGGIAYYEITRSQRLNQDKVILPS